MEVAERSSAFQDVAYDRGSQVLTVVFKDGSVGHHYGVPEAVYEDFINSKSMGAYYNKEIRSVYKFESIRGHK